MHPTEQRIISTIEEYSYISRALMRKLDALPLGTLSQEFLTDVQVTTYCANDTARFLSLRLALEEYIASNYLPHYLEKIETIIMQLPAPMGGFSKGLQNKAAGTYLLPLSSELIRQVFLLEDDSLTRLFQKYFPTPSSQLFAEGSVPDVIQKRERFVSETMEKVDIKTIEPFIIRAQRHARMKKRHQEEIHRIAQRDEFYLKHHHLSSEERAASSSSHATSPELHQWAKALMQDANTPYNPQCAPELAERIRAAAKKVAAFSSVKHITTGSAIKSIFDDALYGRRTLLNFYIPFDPAALADCDLLNGDGNVVCLGPQAIDPQARGGIVIEFDLPKLIKNKPSAFYKQRDLEYGLDKTRQVRLGDELLSFSQDGFVRCANTTSSYLKIVGDRLGDLKQIAELPKSSLIAYNLEQMHEILTLNFFRFMDRMTDLKGLSDKAYIDDFYHKVAMLTEDELLLFLTDLEKNMTDTAEFNFYGAHQLDFSTIRAITARFKKYTLNLPQFISELNKGTIDALRQARMMIPEIFQSYRFLDYLLLHIHHAEARYYLDDLRKQCKTPKWIKYSPLPAPEEFALCWTLNPKPETPAQELPITGEVAKEICVLSSLEPATEACLNPKPIEGSTVVNDAVVQGTKEVFVQDDQRNNELVNQPVALPPKSALRTRTTQALAQAEALYQRYHNNPTYHDHHDALNLFVDQVKKLIIATDTLPIKDAQTTLKKGIQQAAATHLQHRHWLARITCDILLTLSGVGLILLTTRAFSGHSFFLSQDKTNRQHDFERLAEELNDSNTAFNGA